MNNERKGIYLTSRLTSNQPFSKASHIQDNGICMALLQSCTLLGFLKVAFPRAFSLAKYEVGVCWLMQ